MKYFVAVILVMVIICLLTGCQQPVAYVQPVQGQVAPAVVQQQTADPYQVYDNGSGGQVVYYTDPYYHTSYWLDYALFMSMWSSPNRYTVLGNYYSGHRSYIMSRNSYYSSRYTHRYYAPSSPARGSYPRPSSPAYSRPSSPAYNRPSSPSYSRPSAPSYSRPSSPSRRH